MQPLRGYNLGQTQKRLGVLSCATVCKRAPHAYLARRDRHKDVAVLRMHGCAKSWRKKNVGQK